MNKTRPTDIEDALLNLVTGPNAYNDAYKKAIERIANQPDGHRDLAKRTLVWLTLVKERLTKLQLRTALSIRKGISQLSDRDLESTNVILHVCMGLVRIEQGEDDSTISLLHFTTMEYLQANPDCVLLLESPDERMTIASLSLSEIDRKRKVRRFYEGRTAASYATYLRFTAIGNGQYNVEVDDWLKHISMYTFTHLHETENAMGKRLSNYPLYLCGKELGASCSRDRNSLRSP